MSQILYGLNNENIYDIMPDVLARQGLSFQQFQTQLAAQMPKTRAGIARIRAGTGRLRVAILGDSTSIGTGSGTGSPPALNGAWPFSFGKYMAAQLSQYGLPTHDISFIGNQNVSGTISYPLYDTRATLGASWNPSSERSLGGAMWRFTGAATTGLDMAVNFSGDFVDTVTVYYLRLTGNGTFTIKAGDNAGVVVNTSGATGIQSVTINCTRGNNITATASATSGTPTMLIYGMVGFDSTIPGIDLYRCGFYGGTPTDFIGASAYGSLAALAAFAPNLSLIELTINPARINTPLDTYAAEMQTLITNAKASGDVVVAAGIPSASTIAPLATTAQFGQVCKNLAAANNVPFISVADRWISYDVSNPLGYYYDTTGHGLKPGYADKAALYAALIQAAA